MTSGPDPHPPPIADDESDDEDDDDVPRVSRVSTFFTFNVDFQMIFKLTTFIVYCDLCLALGGPLCLAGKGLGDQSVPYHP